MIFFLWVVFALLVGVYAKSNNKSGFFPSLLLSLLLSPVIGFIVVALTKPNDKIAMRHGELKKCPFCAELIKHEATVCRYCGKDLVQQTTTEMSPSLQTTEHHFLTKKYNNEPKNKISNKTILTKDLSLKHLFIVIGIILLLCVLVSIGSNSSGGGQRGGMAASNKSFVDETSYYINQQYQCIKTPKLYPTEDNCMKAVGTYCYNDSTCGGDSVKLMLYYINSSGRCMLAPHNPYSPIGGSGGKFNQEMACSKDVGQTCYVGDDTCGGAGSTGSMTINGATYKLSTASELIQNFSNPGFAGNVGNGASMIVVKGTLKAIFPEKGNGVYDLVINTVDGLVVVTQGTIDPNTKTSNGFYPSNFPVGAKLTASGAFMGNSNGITLDTFAQVDPNLASMHLPSNTPLLFSEGANGVQTNKSTGSTIVPSNQPAPTPPPPSQSNNIVTGSSQTIQTVPAPQVPAVTDYTQFPPTYFYDYVGDPPAYLNVKIKVKGTINNQFLAAGDKGGNSNYIGIADPNARSSDTVMLKVSNNSDYQKAVSALQYEDLVAVYGTGATSQYFTSTNGAKILVPVIVITRLDVVGACGVSGCGEDTAKTIFP